MMKILIVEDDHLQGEWILSGLDEVFHGASIKLIDTEFDFRASFDRIANDPPDVVVMDVMLRWANPSPTLEVPPEEIQKEGFYRAGLRCEALLAGDVRTSHIPVILYTVLERGDLDRQLQTRRENVIYLPKESDQSPLHQQIRELMLAKFLNP